MEQLNSNFKLITTDAYCANIKVNTFVDGTNKKLYDAVVKIFCSKDDFLTYTTFETCESVNVLLYLLCYLDVNSCFWTARLLKDFTPRDLDSAIKFANFAYDFVDKLLRNNFTNTIFTYENLEYFIKKVGFTRVDLNKSVQVW